MNPDVNPIRLFILITTAIFTVLLIKSGVRNSTAIKHTLPIRRI